MDKNGHLTFQATKLALESTIVRFPNFKRKSLKMKPEPGVVFVMLNISVHFLKVLLNREICYEILHMEGFPCFLSKFSSSSQAYHLMTGVALQRFHRNNEKEMERARTFLRRFAQQP